MTIELTPDAPKQWQAPRAKTLLFAGLGLLYVYVLVTTESFLFDKSSPEWAHIAPFQHLLLPHVLVAVFPLFLGPLQFSERLRRKYALVHKTIGYLYITGCYLGAPLGAYIQWFQERLGESRNFTIAGVADAALWMFATTMALVFIRQRKIQQHRQWMIRSFSCALIFLEVRAIVVLFHIPPQQIEIVVWCCIAATFPLADLVLQIDELRRGKARLARA
jgi:hypothetical protein